MSEINHVFMGMYFTALILCIGPITYFRCWHILATSKYLKKKIYFGFFEKLFLISEGKISKPKFNVRILKRFWILSTIDKIYYWLMFYCFYVSVGPWSIHEIIDGHMGVVLLWGTFIRGSFLPGTLSYFYGFWQLIFCQFPVIFVLARIVEKRYDLFKYFAI